MERIEVEPNSQLDVTKEIAHTLDQDTQEVRHPVFQPAHESRVSCESMSIHSLAPAEALTLKTRNSSYRIIMLDRTSQKVIIRGGKHFQQPTEACLLGAATGKRIQVGRIVLGQGFGIAVGRRCFVTSPVEAIDRRVMEMTENDSAKQNRDQ